MLAVNFPSASFYAKTKCTVTTASIFAIDFDQKVSCNLDSFFWCSHIEVGPQAAGSKSKTLSFLLRQNSLY